METALLAQSYAYNLKVTFYLQEIFVKNAVLPTVLHVNLSRNALFATKLVTSNLIPMDFAVIVTLLVTVMDTCNLATLIILILSLIALQFVETDSGETLNNVMMEIQLTETDALPLVMFKNHGPVLLMIPLLVVPFKIQSFPSQ